MIRFNNDYNHGAHPKIIEAFSKYNNESYGGYGLDLWCEKAAEEIKKYIECPQAAIHFLVGGTQANFTVISAALRPFQGVISANTGHINAHETGAVEHCGHKIHALPHLNGKISAEQIAKEAESYLNSSTQEHITQPKMVYISFPTEYGTIYTKNELSDISAVCKKYNLYLFIDGARLGYGLGASNCDLTIKDIAAFADVFYCGGTKCGAMFGEAVVITNPELNVNFRSYIKQNGGMLAKGWLLGLQFYTLFKDGLYFEITRKADEYAVLLKNAFEEQGISSYIESFTNQQFVILNKNQIETLGKSYIFEFDQQLDEEHASVRFCTGWHTTREEIDKLISDIKKL